MGKNLLSLCLFLPTGHTFTFREVEIAVDNESVLVLNYKAMSDGFRKTATIQKSAIVGWSVLEDYR
jgi:hypothetical protein